MLWFWMMFVRVICMSGMLARRWIIRGSEQVKLVATAGRQAFLCLTESLCHHFGRIRGHTCLLQGFGMRQAFTRTYNDLPLPVVAPEQSTTTTLPLYPVRHRVVAHHHNGIGLHFCIRFVVGDAD